MSRSCPLLLLGLAVAGGFVLLSTFAFADGASEAIAFGVSIATLLASVVTAAKAPSSAARTLTASIGLVSAWTILVLLGIFSGATQSWLIFAGGATVAGAALIASGADDVRRQRAQLVAVPQTKAA